MTMRWSDKKQALVRELVAQEISLPKIAARVGCHRDTLVKFLTENKIKYARYRKGRTPLSANVKRHVLQLLTNTRLHESEIATQTGVHPSTVTKLAGIHAARRTRGAYDLAA